MTILTASLISSTRARHIASKNQESWKQTAEKVLRKRKRGVPSRNQAYMNFVLVQSCKKSRGFYHSLIAPLQQRYVFLHVIEELWIDKM